jgi:hypothetical protein
LATKARRTRRPTNLVDALDFWAESNKSHKETNSEGPGDYTSHGRWISPNQTQVNLCQEVRRANLIKVQRTWRDQRWHGATKRLAAVKKTLEVYARHEIRFDFPSFRVFVRFANWPCTSSSVHDLHGKSSRLIYMWGLSAD